MHTFIPFAYYSVNVHNGIAMSAGAPSSVVRNGASRRGRTGDARRQVVASRRTTITLSPEAQEIVERFKNASGASTSAAIDRIIQRSEPKPSRLNNVNGFLVLNQPAELQSFTLEDIKRAEDEMDREYVERFLHRDREPALRKRKTGKR